jgi:hypothetical protein
MMKNDDCLKTSRNDHYKHNQSKLLIIIFLLKCALIVWPYVIFQPIQYIPRVWNNQTDLKPFHTPFIKFFYPLRIYSLILWILVKSISKLKILFKHFFSKEYSCNTKKIIWVFEVHSFQWYKLSLIAIL